ncbi:conserved hypothetical protein [Listeria seeligeri FSL N1-067]|nr:conserved hypothetical protein [Listeria seeligeri FSL N1-067]
MLSTERGIYKINTKLFNRACTWDLFIESEINGFRNRKRVGSSRDFNELSVIENPSSNNQSYQTKAYLTKPLSNLSFQVIAK